MNPINRIQNWHKTRNLDLSSMPPDIQQLILSQNPELIKKGRQLNKGMRDRLSDVYYEDVCSQPLTTRELFKYYAKFYIYRKDDIITLNFIGRFKPGWGNFFRGEPPSFQNVHTIKHYKDRNANLFEYKFEENPWPINDGLFYSDSPIIKEIKKNSHLIIDSGTYFKVLSNRLDCVNGHPMFALNETKRVFNLIIQQNNSVIVFLYLIGHLWLFGIKYPLPQSFRLDPSQLDDFNEAISPMIANIIDSLRFDSIAQKVSYDLPENLQTVANQFQI